jgi:hypothetical protein
MRTAAIQQESSHAEMDTPRACAVRSDVLWSKRSRVCSSREPHVGEQMLTAT